MTQALPAIFKIPTKSPQPARGKAARPAGQAKAGRCAPGRVLAAGTGRVATRGGGEVIVFDQWFKPMSMRQGGSSIRSPVRPTGSAP